MFLPYFALSRKASAPALRMMPATSTIRAMCPIRHLPSDTMCDMIAKTEARPNRRSAAPLAKLMEHNGRLPPQLDGQLAVQNSPIKATEQTSARIPKTVAVRPGGAFRLRMTALDAKQVLVRREIQIFGAGERFVPARDGCTGSHCGDAVRTSRIADHMGKRELVHAGSPAAPDRGASTDWDGPKGGKMGVRGESWFPAIFLIDRCRLFE